MIGHGQVPRVLVGRDRADAQRAQGLRRRGHLRRAAHRHLQPLPADLVLELVGGALGDDPPAVDDRDRVGEPVGLLEILRREQQRGALPDQLADDVPHAQPAARVEPGRRLVQEQHGGSGHQRPGQVQPAPHAPGIALHDPVGGVGEVEPLEQLAGALTARPARQVIEAPDHVEVLETGEQLIDRGVLPGQSDDPPQRGRVCQHVDAGHAGPAGVGLEQGGEHAYGGGLARAVGPEQPGHGALGHRQVEAVEGLDLAVALADPLATMASRHAAPSG